LSRACLGKMIVFIYKWRKKWRFSHHSRGSACRPSRRGSESCRGGSRGDFPCAHKTSAACILEVSGDCPEPVLANDLDVVELSHDSDALPNQARDKDIHSNTRESKLLRSEKGSFSLQHL
jgi:hypothetical protein